MIKYNPKNWIKMIFALHKSDTMRMLWKELIYVGVFTLLLAYVEITYFPNVPALEKLSTLYSLIGFVISLLLVFRTNTAYDRWWEGRKKWGAFVNDSRNLAIKSSLFFKTKEDRDFMRRMIANFVIASKEHLRECVDFDELEITEEEKTHLFEKKHVPAAISKLIYERFYRLRDSGAMSGEDFLLVDKNINALLDSLGACERIRNTPIPFSYSLFLKKFIFIYVTTLPLAFVTIFGYYSALVATFVFYVLVSMEVLAEEIEDPFGRDDNDLPTDEICANIRNNVDELLK